MKIAVISDIHGNRLALEAVLDDIARQGAELTVNLGDVVSGPMDPDGVVARLAGLDLPTVRGNHDRAVSEMDALGRVDAFVAAQLGPDHRAWLAALPATRVEGELFLCHGTPASDETFWLDGKWSGRSVTVPDEAAVAAAAEGIGQPVLLCGHTHQPHAVRLADGRLIVNPGSVGLQFGLGAPEARYATLERRAGQWRVTFHMVPYDHEGAARQAEANGFAHWRAALTTGWAGAAGLF